MVMFGILKKKLKETVEKISDALKAKTERTEPSEIEEKKYEIEKVEEIKHDIEYKEKLISESGYDVSKHKEELFEPYEKVLEREEIEEIKREIESKEEVKVEEKTEIEKAETPPPTEETKTQEEAAAVPVEKFPAEEEKQMQAKIPERSIEEKVEIVEKTREEPAVEEKKVSILQKLKGAILEKEIRESDISDLLWEMQTTLIENDVALDVAEKICLDLKKSLVGLKIRRGEDVEILVENALKKSITELLSYNSVNFDEVVESKKPFLILFLGFNGTGKTTTIAKVAQRLKKNGKSIVLAAGDTWRAAAIEQLSEHGKNLGVPVIKQKYMADAAAVIFDARKYAEAHGIDVILADTAGRSHANANLMDELKKIVRVNNPDLKVLVLDALTGNDIYDQCKLFDAAVNVDGFIITKADVYEKGGALLSAAYTLKKPIFFLGTGQNYDDLKTLDADEIIENLFGG